LSPALLLCFDSFFIATGPPLCCGKRPVVSTASTLSPLSSSTPAMSTPSALVDDRDHEAGQYRTPDSTGDADDSSTPSCWLRIGRCTTTPVVSICIIVVFAMVSGLLSDRVLHMATTVANNLIFPRNAPSYETLQRLNSKFSPGVLSPYTIAASTSLAMPPASLLTDAYFRTANALIADLLALTPSLSILSITYVCPGAPAPCVNLTVAQAQALRTLEPAYAYLWDTSINSAQATCTVMSISLPFDPMDDAAVPWLANARRVAAHYSATTPFQFGISGGIMDSVDVVDRIDQLFPTVIALTGALVFAFTGLWYRTAMLPVRLVITIGLPISWIYGLSDFVFTRGVFNSWIPVLATTPGVYWLTPIMTFSVLVGLALDYDLFSTCLRVDFRRKWCWCSGDGCDCHVLLLSRQCTPRSIRFGLLA
jgi:hypothetical protein